MGRMGGAFDSSSSWAIMPSLSAAPLSPTVFM